MVCRIKKSEHMFTFGGSVGYWLVAVVVFCRLSIRRTCNLGAGPYGRAKSVGDEALASYRRAHRNFPSRYWQGRRLSQNGSPHPLKPCLSIWRRPEMATRRRWPLDIRTCQEKHLFELRHVRQPRRFIELRWHRRSRARVRTDQAKERFAEGVGTTAIAASLGTSKT